MNLGSESSSSLHRPPTAVPEVELLNLLSSQTKGDDVRVNNGNSNNADLLQDLFQTSDTSSRTSFVAAPSTANPFFTLDSFDPLVEPDVSLGAPNNLSTSNSFGNFGSVQESHLADESLMNNWDSILKQTNTGSRPVTLPSLPRNSSTPNLDSKSMDPLGDLGNLMGLSGATNSTIKPQSWGTAMKPGPPFNAGQ